MKKIGILGGTFDPVHNGHLYVAEKAMSHFKLDKLIFLPNGNPPHKNTVSASGEQRLQMLRLATAAKPGFEIEDCEVAKETHSYTYETLEYLNKKYSGSQLYFIAGADNINEIAGWREPEKIFLLAKVVFISRPHYETARRDIELLEKEFRTSVDLLEVEGADVSATEIRERLGKGEPIEHLVPQAVEKYILEHHLYQPEYMQYLSRLKEILCPKRFLHTIGVAKMAEKLAEHYGIDRYKAYLAGLLHDCAKNLPEKDLRELIKRNTFPIYEGELDNPRLLHSIAGSVVAKEVFAIEEEQILSAIRYHTIGRVGMTMLEKIVYVADLIEENRVFSLVEKMREFAFINLDQAVLLSIENNIDYLKRKNQPVLQETYRIRDSLMKEGVHL